MRQRYKQRTGSVDYTGNAYTLVTRAVNTVFIIWYMAEMIGLLLKSICSLSFLIRGNKFKVNSGFLKLTNSVHSISRRAG